MKRRILSLMLAVCMVLSVSAAFSISALADDANKCGENLTWTFNDGTLTISGTGNMYDWVDFDAPWSSLGSDIAKVVINDGVTSIGTYAFFLCDNLTEVTVADSVASIGVGAFSFCSLLGSITIPDKVTSIPDDAFAFCLSLEEVELPDSLTSIGPGAFSDCSSLTSVTVPNGVTNIDEMAFYCSGLTSITLPKTLTSIGEQAFDECPDLAYVYYMGSEKAWDNITIGSSNGNLLNATFEYGEGVLPVSISFIEAFYGDDKIIANVEFDRMKQDGNVLMAVYDEHNRFVGMANDSHTTDKDTTALEMEYFGSCEGYIAKIMYWNSMSGMQPLAETVMTDIFLD